MSEEWWHMYIACTWCQIELIEENKELWHQLWDVTEDCVCSVLLYWMHMANDRDLDRIQFSHPTSEWLIEVRKKKLPRYKKLFYIFK